VRFLIVDSLRKDFSKTAYFRCAPFQCQKNGVSFIPVYQNQDRLLTIGQDYSLVPDY
jgi:hypothetical protein